ncbi:MAG: zf-HC2 domain-containing protein [Anaerolineae bacterium]|nr:zf-HC2 domain-containing protein [Anaerolineae bacterium]
MNERHVEDELIAYLDGELGAAERARVEAHLAHCPACAAALEELRVLSRDLDATFDIAMSPVCLSYAAASRIRDVLRDRLERPRWQWAFWQKRGVLAQAVMALLLILFSFNTYQVFTFPAPPAPQETLVLGQNRFAPGTEAALRVIVRTMGAAPVAGAEIAVQLVQAAQPARVVYEGVTDPSGSTDVTFAVPDDLSGTLDLVVETRSTAGESRIVRPIHIERAYKIYLAGDKSAYRPGQTLHARALVLDATDFKSVSTQQVTFELLDAEGKPIGRSAVTLSEFGVAAWDIDLPAAISLGIYTLHATVGDTISERAITVDTYDLPAFNVTLTTSRAFYAPGEVVQGTVDAAYFFGKPVAGGQVTLGGRDGVLAAGETDAQGRFDFSFSLPVDVPVADSMLFELDVEVTDVIGQRVGLRHQVPVAPEPILIKAIPESGWLKPGIENTVFVMTAYPDGTPAETTLTVTVDGRDLSVATTYGLAELRFTPTAGAATLDILAQDAAGVEGRARVALQADRTAGALLLRAEKAAYTVGDTLRLEALLTGDTQTVYLDVIHAQQTAAVLAAPVVDGRATFALDLDNTLVGALELRAYTLSPEGDLVTDTRLVVVDAPSRVAVDISTDRESYYPGETAHVNVQTSRETDGVVAPVEAALGIAVVDASVYALDTLPSGFARAYFLLEQSMLERRDVAGLDTLALLEADATTRAAQDMAAQAAWAGAPVADFSLRAMSTTTPVDEGARARHALAGRLALVVALLPLLVSLIVVRGLALVGVLRRALRRLGWGLLGTVILAPLAIAGIVLALLLPAFVRVILAGLLSVILVLLAVVLIYGWQRHDVRVQLVAGLLAVYLLLGGLLVVLAAQGHGPAGWSVFVLVVTFLLLVGALVLLGQGLVVEGRRAVGWVTTALAILLIFLAVTLPAVPALTSGLTRALGNPLVYAGPLAWMSGCATPAPQVIEKTVEVEKVIEKTVEVEIPVEIPPTPSPMPTAVPEATALPIPAEPYPLRHIFPETLYWAPEALTGPDGTLAFDLPLADTITTWKLTALASTRDGDLGAMTYDLVVFQDFFIELTFADEIRVGEPLTITATIYNFLPEAQNISVLPSPDTWYALLSSAETVMIPADGIVSTQIVIRPDERGTFLFRVNAEGAQMGDAVAIEVMIP